MTYEMRHWPELVRSLIVAVLTALVASLSGLDPSGVTDWRLWATGVGVGAAHYATMAALAFFTAAAAADSGGTGGT